MRALLGPFLSPGANAVVTGRVPFQTLRAVAALDDVGRLIVCEPAHVRRTKLRHEFALHPLPKAEVEEFAVGLQRGVPLASPRLAPAVALVCDRATANVAVESASGDLQVVLVVDGAHEEGDGASRLATPDGFVRLDLRDGQVLLARRTDARAAWLGDAFATFAPQSDARGGALPGPGSRPELICVLRRHLQEVLARGRFARLVDIGCGPAVLAREAWRAGVAYVGVDVVGADIDAARRSCAHVPDATFLAADARFALDVPSEGSLVIVKEVMQHLGADSRRALLDQLARFDDVLLVDDAALEVVEAPSNDGGYAPVSMQESRLAGFEPSYTYYVNFSTKLVRGRTRRHRDLLLRPPDSPAGTSSDLPGPVYEAAFHGFGDLWATVSEALDRSMLEDRPTHLARVFSDGLDLGRTYETILDVLDPGGGRVEVVDAPGTHDLNLGTPFGENPWRAGLMWRRYRPAIQTWSRERAERRIVVQLESLVYENGRYGRVKPSQFNQWRALSQELVEGALSVLAETGLEIVPLGAHLSVRACVELAATSRLFVGMDSGMAHLCHSVRVPCAIFAYAAPGGVTERTFHGGHPYEPFTDEDSLRTAVERLLAAE